MRLGKVLLQCSSRCQIIRATLCLIIVSVHEFTPFEDPFNMPLLRGLLVRTFKAVARLGHVLHELNRHMTSGIIGTIPDDSTSL